MTPGAGMSELRAALETIAEPGCEASRFADENPPVPDRCLDENYIEHFEAESGERCAPCLARAALARPAPLDDLAKKKRIDWSDVVVDEGDEAP